MSSKLQDVCWLIGESLNSDKSSRSQEVTCSVRESTCSDKTSRLQDVFWLIGESVSPDKSS